jgi:hypothetical protein
VRRIDLDDGSGDSLEDAVRQLEALQRRGERESEESPEEAKRRHEEEREAAHRRSRQSIEGALEEIRERQEVAEGRTRRRRSRRVVWIALGVAFAVLLAVIIMTALPERLPAPAVSAREAVRGFWASVILGKYEAATVYYPGLVAQYGNRKQAALRLEEWFKQDPPVHISSIGDAKQVPESGDLRVSYQVYMRSGRPRNGEAIVSNGDKPDQGYVILSGI